MEPKESFRGSAVNLGAVSRMGAHEADLKKPPGMFKKSGVEAPKAAVTQHHCGSQGKHK